MQHKLGNDVLRFASCDSPVKFGKGDYSDKILEILSQVERPLCISEIQRLAGVGSWIKTKSEVMDLVISGKVEVFKSGRQFLFRVKKQSNSQRVKARHNGKT